MTEYRLKALLFRPAIASAGGVGNMPLPVIAFFLAGSLVNSVFGHSAYALLLSSGPVRGACGRARRWIEAELGGCFAFAAVTPATTRS